MADARSRVAAFVIAVSFFVASYLALVPRATAQWYPNHEVQVSGLQPLMARSHDPLDVLLTSLDIVIHKTKVCCGPDSALADSAEKSDPTSLKDVATKLQGRHLLSDGRPIMATAEYFEPAAINSGMLVGTLRDQRALLLQWNSHIYICYGVVYDEIYDENGGVQYSIRKLQLLDTRYSDSRRRVVFNRDTDDWSKVQGMLRVTSSRQ
ncbi:MAG TPA: hypothetical protein VFL34_12075 [Candidatus Sulfotelmatobacter sp.]|nr:hypothetical protein [Candidatus Sulfotelmatobacter sp.]